MSKPKSQPTAYAQLYVYERKSLLATYQRIASALFVGEWAFTLAAVSPKGSAQAKGVKSVEKAISLLAEFLRNGVNRFEIVGKSNRSPIPAIRLACDISPMNADWAPVGRIEPNGHKRQDLRMLWSFQSREDYVRLNRLKRDYVFLSVEAVYEENVGALTSKRLIKDFEPFVHAVSETRSKDYIGFIDPGLLLPASGVVGGLPDCSGRIDVHFDKPHMVTFGPPSVLDKYARDIGALASKVSFEKQTVGKATVVAFKDAPQMEKLDLPKWHERQFAQHLDGR